MTLWVGAQLGKLPSCQGTSSLMIRVYPSMHKVQNGQTHLKNLAANAACFLKYVWPVSFVIHYRVKN